MPKHAVNNLNFALSLYTNSDSREIYIKQSHSTFSIGIISTLLLSLIMIAVLLRWIRHHFKRLSETLVRFSRGIYSTPHESYPFEEFNEIQQLLAEMAATIHYQLTQLHEKNEKLAKLGQIRDTYLYEVKQLNQQLTQKVHQQTSKLSLSLEREAASRKLLQGLLDLSSQLTEYRGVEQVSHACIECLSRLLQQQGSVGLYLANKQAEKPELYGEGLTEELQRPLLEQLESHRKSIESSHQTVEIWLDEQPFQSFRLATGGGRYLGNLVVASSVIKPEFIGIFKLFAKQLSAVLEAMQLHSELEQLARTDELTQFANRKAFNEALKHAKAVYSRYRERHFGVFIVDANGLKRVNDRYGHAVGDDLICTLGQVLLNVCRQSDEVFRLGGDEFAIIVEDGSQQSCDCLMSRLIEEVDRHTLSVVVNGQQSIELPLSYSVGFASTETTLPDELFSTADQRMYQQKKSYYQKQLSGINSVG